MMSDAFAILCLHRSHVGSDVNSAMNSPIQPIPTIAVDMYPNHSQPRNADFKDATSEPENHCIAV